MDIPSAIRRNLSDKVKVLYAEAKVRADFLRYQVLSPNRMILGGQP